MNKIFKHLPEFKNDKMDTFSYEYYIKCECGYKKNYHGKLYYAANKIPPSIIVKVICEICKQNYLVEYTVDYNNKYHYTGHLIK